jgi:hypothetical protein
MKLGRCILFNNLLLKGVNERQIYKVLAVITELKIIQTRASF